MDVLAEGIESIKLACSLVLLIPAVGIALMGRRRIWLVPAWILTVSLIAWLRFTGWWTPLPSGVGHVVVGLGLLAQMAFECVFMARPPAFLWKISASPKFFGGKTRTSSNMFTAKRAHPPPF